MTAELAIGLGAVVLCLGAGLQAVALGVEEVRCVDAAHVAARAAARGDPSAAVSELARRRAPRGSVVTVSAGTESAPGGVSTVVVEVVAPPLGGPSWLTAGLAARAAATAPTETGAGVP